MSEVVNSDSPKKKKGLKKVRKFNVLIALLVLASLGASGFFYMKYQDSQDKLKNPEKVAQQETASVVEKVSKHVELPSKEQPTIATVSDVSKLSDQTFFSNAKNGDKVLIYSTSKKAILYRPSTDRVINFAPLNVSNPQ